MTAKLKELETLKHIFWSFFVCLCLIALSYTFLVNLAVRNVADRERIEKEISKLSSELGELEFKYISMRSNINPEYAYSLGFQDVKKQEFISRKKESATLSLKTSE